MKKYKLYYIFVPIFIILFFSLFSFFNVNSAQAYDSGCIGGSLYSITTGQYCGSLQNNYYNNNYNNNYSYGCTAAGPYNTITGLPCSGSQYYNNTTYPYTYPYSYNQVPVISGVNGPQSLNVNQQGTWTVTASNSNGGSLSYSVNWGDQQIVPQYYNNGSTYNLQQSATFVHSYFQTGIYTPIFTVTNSSGQTAQTSLTVRVYGSGNYYSNNAPNIYSITPTSGAVGTQITIYGSGFSTNNCATGYCNNSYSTDIVNFGPSIISGTYSYDGTSLTFTIPSYTNTNSTYPYSNSTYTIPQYPIMSGTYPVFVTNANGVSNVINFSVTYPTRY